MTTEPAAVLSFPHRAPASPGCVEARVEAVDRAAVTVRVGGRRVDARVAIPGYRPSEGDEVLVIASERGAFFVIGAPVAQHALRLERGEDGASVLRTEGDLVIASPGEVRVEARTIRQRAEHVETRAERVEWAVGRWELAADRVRERARHVLREVEETLSTRAGRLRTVVRGAAQLLAERATIRAKEDAVLDGKRVLLG